MKLSALTAGSYLVAKASLFMADEFSQMFSVCRMMEQLDSIEMVNWLMHYFS
jgi:hypothetical protein